MSRLASGRPPFRADHVGSLLRPPALRQAFKQHQNGSIDDATFSKIQDDCIRDVLKLQESTGLEVVNDGEFRRGSYWSRFVERTEGFEIKGAVYTFRDDTGHEYEFTAPYASKKIRRVRPLAVDEFEFVKAHTKLTPKITIPAPSAMHFYRCSDFADAKIYPDAKGFFRDLGKVFQEEIADLAKAGCEYVQLDEVAIAMLCDPTIRDKVKSVGQDPDELVDLYIDAINEAVSVLPSSVRVGVHMCRGNLKGHYLAAGGYEDIAERFFGRAKINHFLLEFDTARAGDFSPLRFVPKGVGVVLGLVTSKSPVLENPDDLKRRVDEATKYIGLDRLAISPQCGFASTVAGNPVTEADERAKLKLCVDTAKAIWK
ncbi:MAG: 5-methyltetrahydropteroyltriglutamate--homocysteine S-methyltransferase [Xanthobacteraceae bacterium]|nr:5-methyltetrahydropteroyltriglutamate--homocysteine S-methyltransferase [Xanthobacteraceae bacterium]